MTDYSYGMKKEMETLKSLQNQFGKDIKKTIGKYNQFDFINADTLIELKSRRCGVNSYPDTMVGLNKLVYAKKNPDKQIIFCFNFNEGLYYHQYCPDKEYKIRDGGRSDRGKAEIKPYFFINSNDLTAMTK